MGLVRTIFAGLAVQAYAAPHDKVGNLAKQWLDQAVADWKTAQNGEADKLNDKQKEDKLKEITKAQEKIDNAKPAAEVDNAAFIKAHADAAPSGVLASAIKIGTGELKTATEKFDAAKKNESEKKDKALETAKADTKTAQEHKDEVQKALALLQGSAPKACMNCLCISILSAIGVIVVIGVVLLVCVMKGKKEQEEEDAEV